MGAHRKKIWVPIQGLPLDPRPGRSVRVNERSMLLCQMAQSERSLGGQAHGREGGRKSTGRDLSRV